MREDVLAQYTHVQLALGRVMATTSVTGRLVAGEASTRADGTRIVVHVPMRFKRHSGRKEIVFPTERAADQAASPAAQRTLIIAVARAHAWLDALEDGRYANVAALAEAVGFDPSYVRRVLNLTLLSPVMVERVLDGQEGDEDALDRLARGPGVVWGNGGDLVLSAWQPLSSIPVPAATGIARHACPDPDPV
jgi:hypothetical protein